MDVQEQWDSFLNPAKLKQNLIACSVFLTAYEMLCDTLIQHPRGFYCDDYSQFPFYPESESYRLKVLGLHKRETSACAIWFKNMGALDESDLQTFSELAAHRNTIAHETQAIITSQKQLSADLLKRLYDLTAKIDQWWIRNVEADVNPNLEGVELSEQEWGNSYSMRMAMMSFMIEVAEGDDARLVALYDEWKRHQS